MKRIYIEKKKDYDSKARNLLREFKDYLEIDNLEDVRIVDVYEMSDISREELDKIENYLFEDENVYESLDLGEGETPLRIKFLDNQYNQKQEMTREIIEKFIVKREVEIHNSEILIFKGISEEDLEKIKSYYVNPIEKKVIELDKYIDVKKESELEEVEVIDNFINFDSEQLKEFIESYGLGLDMEDIKLCQEYFIGENRNPSITELKLIDTYWSDHCRHTTFNTEILKIEIEEGKYKEVFENTIKNYISSREFVFGEKIDTRPVCLMDLATINMREQKKTGSLYNKEESKEVNAASIEIDVDVNGVDEKWLLMFKNETHNHPTEMEPFGGAATCLGGAIRDPLSGRAFVYQAMRISGAGNPNDKFEDRLEGKLAQRTITRTAMEGYSSYGNQIGVPAGYVREYYDDGFVAKRLECGALVAAAPKDAVIREDAEAGDVVILVGGRTGKDGLGGAVGSSKKHTEDSLESGGAEVQKGNPVLERKIMRLFKKKNVSRMIKVCNDFGAGGVGVAIGELADGISIDLDKVPVKYEGLNGTEIALSESQERMAVVVDRNNLENFLSEAEKEDLEATHVATITEEKILKMNWRGEEIVNIDREFLDTNGAKKYIKTYISQPEEKNYDIKIDEKKSLKENFLNVARDMNIASQKGLVENFDNSSGGNNVLMPYGGENRSTPAEGMVSRIPVDGSTKTCSIMTHGYDSKLSTWSPYHGGYFAVIDSVSRLVALGGDFKEARLSFQEYFERLGQDERKWGKPLSALLGAYEVQRVLDIPAIGGKDSMSGTFEDIDVPPTLISFAVGHENIDNIVSNELKSKSSYLYLVDGRLDENNLLNLEELRENFENIRRLNLENKILSANSIKYGGIARCLLEMSVGNRIGLEIENKDLDLFATRYGSIIIEVEDPKIVENLSNFIPLGKTSVEDLIKIDGEIISLGELEDSFESTWEGVFPIGKNLYEENRLEKLDIEEEVVGEKLDRVKVLIPIITGTNGEYSLSREFNKLGAEVEMFVFKTLQDIDESIEEFESKIETANIIAFPDGASFGNEPDGEGKIMNIILRDERIKKALENHLEDGLILGIGNGLKGLVRAGLIENFKIVDNDTDKFISEIVDIEINSTLTPFVREMKLGDLYSAPLATKEGKIVVENEDALTNGQIISVFKNRNLTGSEYNIESISSVDGRVYGCLSGIDRIDESLYKNIDIKGLHKIFNSAMSFFK